MMINALVFLLAAVVCVPVAKKLGFGSVLGYLMGGLIIGPWGLKLIDNVEDIMKFSEFGVVLLLFIIGLELEPKKLWPMRIPIFGMGGVQILSNICIISVIGIVLGQSFNVSILVAMGFALSSTAIALQILNEKKMMSTTAGRAGFSILLFQDIAVIPMIALLPMLGAQTAQSGSWFGFLKVVGVIVAVIVAGRFLLRHMLRFIAGLHIREIFTAFALLLVLSMAALMHSLEISMALGAFIAGVLLADSEYRTALETDIEPFKGLLLGLFFISVGMSVNVDSVVKSPLLIIGLVLALYILKSVIHLIIAKAFKIPKDQVPFFSIVISQVGEFAFVLFGAAKGFGILSEELSGLLLAVVAFSMLATPLVVLLYDKVFVRLFCSAEAQEPDAIENENSDVIIAGFGRFGQIVGRLLYANKIKVTVLDHEAELIETVRRFGFKVYFGDATRLDLLEAAGIQQAKVLVIAIDDQESNLRLVDLAQQHFPHVKIFARARDVQHVYDLMDRKVSVIERETFESALKMGGALLNELGWAKYQSVVATHKFRAHNLAMLEDIHPSRKDEKLLISKSKQARADLEKMFNQEENILQGIDTGWDI